MTSFRSCHLIVNRKLPDDRRRVRDFIDADFFVGEIFILYFWNGLHPQTPTFSPTILLVWGKR